MAEALRGCLSLTLSGFAYASHDIGGFEVTYLSTYDFPQDTDIISGVSPTRDLSTMGSVRTFFVSLTAPWLLIVSSTMAIWRRRRKKHGEVCDGETSSDALHI